MQKTVAELASFVDGRVDGDDSIVIKGISGIKEASKGDITFLANPKYLPLLEQTQASAIFVAEDVDVPHTTVIKVTNPSLAFTKVADLFIQDINKTFIGIHPTAVIANDVSIGADVGIGPHVVIESGAIIGDHVVIQANAFIGESVKIGSKSLIYPNVTIRERSIIGACVIIHSGTVVGSDGYGYIDIDGRQMKIPQLGIVVIGDDVEIGANVTIDRARFNKTIIGRGTKIDNLVQIAHNVQIGEDCMIIAQSGISGSSVLENKVILAGQAGVAGHLTIGAGAIVAAQAGVTKSVEPGTMVAGYPAREFKSQRKIEATVNRLPKYVETIKELTKRVDALETKLNQHD